MDCTWHVAKFKAALARDGCYLLRSNQGGWTAAEFWETYMQLTVVEHAFRVLKSHLESVPKALGGLFWAMSLEAEALEAAHRVASLGRSRCRERPPWRSARTRNATEGVPYAASGKPIGQGCAAVQL